jgi:hypothetical protein
MSERQIDKAIDDAVRDLMNVDADPAFRARVAARLQQRPAHFSGWRQLAIASAALAAIVIGMVLFRDGDAPAVRQAPVSSVASNGSAKPAPEVSAAPPARPLPLPAPAPDRATARRTAPRPPITGGNVTQEIPRAALLATVADAVEAAGGEPAGSFRPIEVQPITAAPIRPPQLEIAPLAPIGQIVIAPLDPRIQRN